MEEVSAQAKEIVDKEIRGVTAKTITWFLGGIISVIITVMGTYFSIIRKMDTINVIQSNVNLINARVDKNIDDIKEIKQHSLPQMDTRISVIEQQLNDKTIILKSR